MRYDGVGNRHDERQKPNCPSKKCNAPSRLVRIAVKVPIIPWITSLYSNGPSIEPECFVCKNNKLLLKRRPCIDNLTFFDVVTKNLSQWEPYSVHFVRDLLDHLHHGIMGGGGGSGLN